MASNVTWTKENSPRWDADKRRVFGEQELAAVGLVQPADDAPVADEWFALARDGETVGYGWLDTEWGDAEITFVVARDARGSGLGAVVLDRLEAEAASRGLNYVYNVVPDSHPDAAWMTTWLTVHGFTPAADGTLRRRVRARTP